MAIVKVIVPDGENCKGCNYLSHSSYESHYQSYTETYSCQLFKSKINNNQKCPGCMIASVNNENN